MYNYVLQLPQLTLQVHTLHRTKVIRASKMAIVQELVPFLPDPLMLTVEKAVAGLVGSTSCGLSITHASRVDDSVIEPRTSLR
jgi:hypothetical protein